MRRQGWGVATKAAEVKKQGPERFFGLCLLVLSLCKYWDSVRGAVSAVASIKPSNRRFAWGVESWGRLITAMTNAATSHSEDHFRFLATIFDQHSERAGLPNLA